MRAKKARKWAFLTMVLLVGTSLGAIWQDKRLAPPVHTQMVRVAGMIGSSERVQEYMASLSKTVDQVTGQD